MMIEIPISRRRCFPTIILVAILILSSGIAAPCAAEEEFPGYPQPVRMQIRRVVETAGPGKGKDLAGEVRTLRRMMYSHGVLSVNVIPDLVFRRAEREGWKKDLAASFRVISEVSPLSAQMWAWMVKEDILNVRPADLVYDFDGLSGALQRFGPALLGYAAWVISFGSAAACWFAVWAALALFLRARPSLERDISRIARLPWKEYLAPVAAVAVFLLPLAAGFGLVVVACYWMVLSVAYLRRGELILMTSAILLLAALLVGGSMLHLMVRVTGDAPRESWLGVDGYIPRTWPGDSRRGDVPGAGPSPSWLIKYSRARSAMQGGNPSEAESLWSQLVEEGKDLPEVRNNRGIARAKQGKMREALSDFEAAFEIRPGYGPALWNAYQAYLQVFNLERARMVQPLAWDAVQRISPFRFRPADMEAGEWLASSLPVGQLMQAILGRWRDMIREAGEGEYFRMFFRPLTPRITLLFLIFVWLSSVIWKLFCLRFWVHNTCRACGTHSLIVGIREASDFCNMCKARVGWGIRAGEEKERRGLGIRMHRNYVRAGSLLVPGFGGLWSGNEIRTMIYAVFLSLSLGGVSVSLGARLGGDIVSELQSIVTRWAILFAGLLWFAGAAWGIWAFGKMQRYYGISGKKG